MPAHAAHRQESSSALDFSAVRLNMIEGQLRPNGIKNACLLDVIEALPRELFIAPPDRGISCADAEIMVSSNRALLRPLVQARLLQAAELSPTDKVLDIACGSGYSSALAAKLAQNVVALEENEDLARLARANLADCGINNVAVKVGTLQDGWTADGPYNAIIINGAVEQIPDAIANQLAEGGRLVAVLYQAGLGDFSFTSQLTVYRKMAGTLQAQPIIEATASTLVAFQRPKSFVF